MMRRSCSAFRPVPPEPTRRGSPYERLGAGLILGNSLLTARGIPASGEGDLKTCLAMIIGVVIAILALAPESRLQGATEPPAVHTLPAAVDAAAESPADEIGQSKAVASSIGEYREVGENRNDRVAYLFEASAPDRLIRLTLSIPDDKPRLAEVSIIADSRTPWAQPSLGTGYFCGFPFHLTLKMVEQAFYFYVPLGRRFAVVVMTSKAGAPAAIAKLEVEEVGEHAWVPQWPESMFKGNRRQLGLYWEDPVLYLNFGVDRTRASEDGEFQRILDRQVAYLKRVGHNLVIYPVVWYIGALYQPSPESAEFVPVPSMFRRPHPADFDKTMARRYSESGIDFWPSIRNWSLPSLLEWVRSPDEIKSGMADEYVNTVTATGVVKTDSKWHDPPVLNALHPRVQAAMRNLATEIMDRIGSEPSVKGLALFTTIHSSHGLGTADQSYDDYTVKRFAADAKLALPEVSGPPGTRFRQWYTWLRNEHWAAWIDWRKGKQTEFYGELASIVAMKKPGAKLQLMVKYPIPTLYAGLKVDDVGAYLDDIGLDLQALAQNKDIVISRIYRQAIYQRELVRKPEDSPEMHDLPARSRLDFDPAWQLPFLGKTEGSVIQYNYFEQKLTNWPKLKFPKGWNIVELDGHVTSPKGVGRYALEYLAQSIALFDARFVTHGGYQIGAQGMEHVIQPFSATFSSLPDIPFDVVSAEDGVVVRTAVAGDERWIYAVNSTDREREISLTFSSDGMLYRLGLTPEESNVGPEKPLAVMIAPFDLLAWKCRAGVAPSVMSIRNERRQ